MFSFNKKSPLMTLKGILGISIIAGLLLMPIPAMAQFSDLKSHWADPAVSKVAALDLIKGYPDNSFKPEQELSQIESLVLFMRGAGYNFDKTSTKKNANQKTAKTIKTPAVPWGQSYLDAAAQDNLLPQEWLDNFNADAPANRAQVVVLLCRLLHLPPVENEGSNEAAFSDLANTSPDYIPYIMALSKAEIMKGYDDGTFRPQQSLKRAEAAALLSGLVEQNWVKVDAERKIEGWVQSISVQGTKSEMEMLSLNGVQKIKLDPAVRYFNEAGECKYQEILYCRVEALLNSKKQASYISLLEKKSPAAIDEYVVGSVKSVVVGENAVLVINDLNSQEKKLHLSSSAVLEDLAKGKANGFNTLKAGIFVKAYSAGGEVVKVSILQTKNISGTIYSLTNKRLDLGGNNSKSSKSSTGDKPEWFNYWDRARVVDKDGKPQGSVKRGDKVKITYLDTIPGEIDDEIPLEIAVTSSPALKKAKGEVESTNSVEGAYRITVKKNKEYEVDDSVAVYLPDGTKTSFNIIEVGNEIEMEVDGAGVVMKISIQASDSE